MFLSDSVVEPASAVVSATIVIWIFLMRRLSVELSTASRGIVDRYTGAMIQWTLNA